MPRGKANISPQAKAGLLAELIRSARLTWRLMMDHRVPAWLKAIVPASLLYLLSPIDLIPDVFLGLGQLDDLAILIMGVKLFQNLCPPAIVQEHLAEMDAVSAPYRVVNEGEADDQGSDAGYLEARYRVLNDK